MMNNSTCSEAPTTPTSSLLATPNLELSQQMDVLVHKNMLTKDSSKETSNPPPLQQQQQLPQLKDGRGQTLPDQSQAEMLVVCKTEKRDNEEFTVENTGGMGLKDGFHTGCARSDYPYSMVSRNLTTPTETVVGNNQVPCKTELVTCCKREVEELDLSDEEMDDGDEWMEQDRCARTDYFYCSFENMAPGFITGITSGKNRKRRRKRKVNSRAHPERQGTEDKVSEQITLVQESTINTMETGDNEGVGYSSSKQREGGASEMELEVKDGGIGAPDWCTEGGLEEDGCQEDGDNRPSETEPEHENESKEVVQDHENESKEAVQDHENEPSSTVEEHKTESLEWEQKCKGDLNKQTTEKDKKESEQTEVEEEPCLVNLAKAAVDGSTNLLITHSEDGGTDSHDENTTLDDLASSKRNTVESFDKELDSAGRISPHSSQELFNNNSDNEKTAVSMDTLQTHANVEQPGTESTWSESHSSKKSKLLVVCPISDSQYNKLWRELSEEDNIPVAEKESGTGHSKEVESITEGNKVQPEIKSSPQNASEDQEPQDKNHLNHYADDNGDQTFSHRQKRSNKMIQLPGQSRNRAPRRRLAIVKLVDNEQWHKLWSDKGCGPSIKKHEMSYLSKCGCITCHKTPAPPSQKNRQHRRRRIYCYQLDDKSFHLEHLKPSDAFDEISFGMYKSPTSSQKLSFEEEEDHLPITLDSCSFQEKVMVKGVEFEKDVDSADLALLKAASESTEARSSSSVPRVYPRTDDHQAPSTEGLLDFKHATVVKSPGIIDKVLTKSDKDFPGQASPKVEALVKLFRKVEQKNTTSLADPGMLSPSKSNQLSKRKREESPDCLTHCPQSNLDHTASTPKPKKHRGEEPTDCKTLPHVPKLATGSDTQKPHVSTTINPNYKKRFKEYVKRCRNERLKKLAGEEETKKDVYKTVEEGPSEPEEVTPLPKLHQLLVTEDFTIPANIASIIERYWLKMAAHR